MQAYGFRDNCLASVDWQLCDDDRLTNFAGMSWRAKSLLFLGVCLVVFVGVVALDLICNGLEHLHVRPATHAAASAISCTCSSRASRLRHHHAESRKGEDTVELLDAGAASAC